MELWEINQTLILSRMIIKLEDLKRKDYNESTIHLRYLNLQVEI